MATSQLTYNPGILGDAELKRSFVVRNGTLQLILETLLENLSCSGMNQHLLFVGPRGIGKTMLVRRVAAEIRSAAAYSEKWYPLVFGEESYPVSTPGEFWLEALFHLTDQTRDPRWEKALRELRDERDESRLRQRALGQLLDFADQEGKRVLLVVENLNMLLGQQMEPHSGWDLRHTLMNEHRVMLLGTATNRFEEIENVDKAWYEMFSIIELKPLDLEECGALWQSVTNSPLAAGPLKAIRILTGGNPRLLRILASFAANRSFRELMEQLVHLIDEHTEYFKSHLDNLAPKERKVFVALLDHWDPAGAAELAVMTRLGVNEASSLLGRLLGRGAVEVVGQKGRRKIYQVAERLYNIYYLMRRRGHPEGRVRAVVNFMVMFYEGAELAARMGELAREACSLPGELRKDHYVAFAEVLQHAPELVNRIFECSPPEFFKADDAPPIVRELMKRGRVSTLLARAHTLYHERELRQAELLYRQVLEEDDANALAWAGLALVLHFDITRHAETEQALRKAIELEPECAIYQNNLANLVRELGRMEEAEDRYHKAIALDPSDIGIRLNLGRLLATLRRNDEAEHVYRDAIAAKPNSSRAWRSLGILLRELGRVDEAEQACRKACELAPDSAGAWDELACVLLSRDRPDEAEQFCRRAIEIDQGAPNLWNNLGNVLSVLDRKKEAKEAYHKAIELDPKLPTPWGNLGHVLLEVGPPEEAEKIWEKALELHPELVSCSVHLLDLRLQRGIGNEEILRQAAEWVDRSHHAAQTLTVMARFLRDAGVEGGSVMAEKWAREAYSKDDNWEPAEILTSVLMERGRWVEAFQTGRRLLEAAATDPDAQRAATEFLIRTAAAGQADAALQQLTNSAASSALEPLAVGLRIYLGEKPEVAKELLEIGADVADRIRQYHTARTSRLPGPATKPRNPTEESSF